MKQAYLAIDLGASSGRAIVGTVDAGSRQVELHEVHRFEHLPVPTPAGPVWDLTGIWHHVLEGLRKGGVWCREQQVPLVSVGADT